MDEDIVKNIISNKLGVDKSSINDDSSLSALAEDSFGKIELLFDVESQLNIKLPQNDVTDIETFGELMSLIRSSK
jgi:acyl carrier protein